MGKVQPAYYHYNSVLMDLSSQLMAKRQQFSRQIRRKTIEEDLHNKRETMIKTIETQSSVDNKYAEEFVLGLIANTYKNYTTLGQHLQVVQHLLSTSPEVLNNKKVTNYLGSLLSKSDSLELRDRILELLVRYVTCPSNYLQNVEFYSMFPILQEMCFLPVWQWVSRIQDYDVKRTCLKVFNKLLLRIKQHQSRNAEMVVQICLSFAGSPTLQAYNMYPFLTYFASLLTSPLELPADTISDIIRVLIYFTSKNADINAMLLPSPILTSIHARMKNINESKAIITYAKFITKLFYKQDISYEVFREIDDIIQVMFGYVSTSKNSKVQVQSLIALCNILANGQKQLDIFMQGDYIPYLVDITQHTNQKVKAEVIGLLYVVCSIGRQHEALIRKLMEEQVFRAIAYFMDDCAQLVDQKCLELIYLLLSSIRMFYGNSGINPNQQASMQLSQYNLNLKVQQYLSHQQYAVSETAQKILSQFGPK